MIFNNSLKMRGSLEKLWLSDMEPTPFEVLKILRLPRLRRLELDSFTEFEDHEPQSPTQQSSTLECFDAHDCHLRHQTLLEIGRQAPSMWKLLCHVPLLGSVRKGRLFRICVMENELSPSHVLLTLSPLARTLTALELHTNGQEWSGHDGSRLDLSGFGNLKSISASAELFVAPLSLGVARDGTHKLLPRSLEQLRVSPPFNLSISLLILNECSLSSALALGYFIL